MSRDKDVRPICPHCSGRLAEGWRSWDCRDCRSEFRALRGIPDLRVAEDGYLASDRDWEWAARLDADYDRLSSAELLERHYELDPETPSDLRRRQIAHIQSAPERAARWLQTIVSADAGASAGAVGMMIPGGHGFLDLGCGSGSFLEAMARFRPDATHWGLDIAMRWLILARKLLEERGLRERVRLVCGNAERLPFADRSFAAAVAGDVIEHVSDQRATLAEAHRVLVGGGRLLMASPNRYSLAPEPHVQVWGVGYLPRPWMPIYVRWVRGLDFRAIRTLGYGEWRALIRSSPFRDARIETPPLPEADFAHFGPVKRTLGRSYNRAVAAKLGRTIARRVGPLFHVICVRGEGDGFSASIQDFAESR